MANVDDIENDPEAQFFDRNRMGGVRRDTIVQQLSVQDQAAIEKIKSDTLYTICFEGSLCIACMVLWAKDDQGSSAVEQYLFWWLMLNGIPCLMKAIFFYVLVEKRPVGRTEWYSLILQYL